MARKSSPLLAELREFRPAYFAILMLSLSGPVVFLITPLYAQQVLERVALSRNESTLYALTFIAAMMMIMYAVLDYLRSRVLQRLGIAIDKKLTSVVFGGLNRQRGISMGSASAQPLNDINSVRDFLSGAVIAAAFDAFWSPVFILAMFMLHPVFGYLAVTVVVISVSLTLLNNWVVHKSSLTSSQCQSRANEFGNSVLRNTDTVVALGMLPRVEAHWYRLHHAALGWQTVASDRSAKIQAANRFVHLSLPITIYFVGALLFLRNEMSIATLIIASILMSRGLGPIERVISSWRSFTNFKSAIERLDGVMEKVSESRRTVSLPPPSGALSVSRIIGTAPNSDKVLINDVSFVVPAGRILGVIGPSGAGKSCLARFLIGRWLPRRGSITLGEREVGHWNEDELGIHLGYMPQDIEMLPGTIAENIARFDPALDTDSQPLIQAANMAGINDLIKEMPQGFNTRVGPGGHVLSGGQRQRLALARALYGNPHFVVLDEPSSSLDASGEQALGLAIERLRLNGSCAVVVTHKLSLLAYCDDVMILNAGTVQAFGQRQQIVDRLIKQKSPTLTVIEGSALPPGASR